MREIGGDLLMRTLRQQAWQRAKGELNAVLATFWDEREKFGELDKAVTDFIEKIDGEGLAE